MEKYCKTGKKATNHINNESGSSSKKQRSLLLANDAQQHHRNAHDDGNADNGEPVDGGVNSSSRYIVEEVQFFILMRLRPIRGSHKFSNFFAVRLLPSHIPAHMCKKLAWWQRCVYGDAIYGCV